MSDWSDDAKRVQAIRAAALDLVVLTEKPELGLISWWSLFARATMQMRRVLEGKDV